MERTARTALAALAVTAAAVMLLRLPSLSRAVQDDGFIYFRIATNAAHGLGPVFTPGERVDAATSPVWLWLLAAATRLGAGLPAAAVWLGLVSAIAAVGLAAHWALELAAPRSILSILLALSGPLLLVADPRFDLVAASGMETALCGLAWLWATRSLFRRWFQDRPEPCAGWAVLVALLVRPEYALFVAAAAALAFLRRKSPAEIGRTLLPALAGSALYLIAHQLYFGDPLPNTYYAKRAADWAHTRIGLAYLARLPRTYPWLCVSFAALCLRPLRHVATVFTLAVGAYALYIASLGGDHFVFHRPFVHVLPLSMALLGASAALLWDLRRRILRAAAAAGMLVLLGAAAQQQLQPAAFDWVRLSARLGYALADTYPAGTRLGLFAIGATGFTSKLPVVDALGIADRHVARCDLSHEHVCALDIGHERGDPDYVLERADVVVLFAAHSPVPFESLDEVREGFYSQKKFIGAARRAVESGRLRLRNVEFAPGTYWAVLERAGQR